MKIIITLLFSFALSVNVFAQVPTMVTTEWVQWQKLAETIVTFDKNITGFDQQMAEIPVLTKDRFLSIQFRVPEAQMDLKSLEVYFENGNKQDFAINESIKGDKYSRIIDLTGEERIITKIVFKYKAIPNTDDDRARLELWGSQLIKRPGEK